MVIFDKVSGMRKNCLVSELSSKAVFNFNSF